MERKRERNIISILLDIRTTHTQTKTKSRRKNKILNFFKKRNQINKQPNQQAIMTNGSKDRDLSQAWFKGHIVV